MPYMEHDPTDMSTFKAYLTQSKRILALCGAGLSASSGLSTFRGAGGLWKTHDAMSLATPTAFSRDPSLVWQFYSARRHAAFSARPNAAHYALAVAALKNKDFITITQNVDGLSPRAGHPPDQLFPVHGSLSTVKCSSFFCNYEESNNFKMALTPALAPPVSTERLEEDASVPVIHQSDLPHCPKCKTGMMRPGVVWFGESLPNEVLDGIDDWMSQGPIDLCLVIGTSGRVYPAAGYIEKCKRKGAKVAIVNLEISSDPELGGLEDADWTIEGDCAKILPDILEPIVGDLSQATEGLAESDTFPPMTSKGGPLPRNGEGGSSRTGEGSGYY